MVTFAVVSKQIENFPKKKKACNTKQSNVKLNVINGISLFLCFHFNICFCFFVSHTLLNYNNIFHR